MIDHLNTSISSAENKLDSEAAFKLQAKLQSANVWMVQILPQAMVSHTLTHAEKDRSLVGKTDGTLPVKNTIERLVYYIASGNISKKKRSE